MIDFLTMGIVLGLYAGFAPGPLLALTVSETLQHDIAAGMKVAVAPIVTDLPIILLTVFVLSRFSGFHQVLGVISLVGGCFVLYLGYGSLKTKGISIHIEETGPGSLKKGILVNALNPSPYLFWFSVGGPAIIQAMGQGRADPFVFVGSFYIFLLGSKAGLALLTGRFKSFLTGKVYIYTMRFLGLVMCALAMVLFREGLKLLEIL
ncbi:MAG: LysE family translocator [Thermodesulfobacteriota bacterium]